MASVYASEANHSKNSPLVLDPVDHTEWNLARDVAHQRCIDAYVEEDPQRKGNDSCIHAILPCLPCPIYQRGAGSAHRCQYGQPTLLSDRMKWSNISDI